MQKTQRHAPDSAPDSMASSRLRRDTEKQRQPAPERSHAADKPTALNSGLLRELAETPRHLD